MPREATATRAALLDAAARLFAERGPESVSLAEINSAARQKNTAAVHYHFRNRDGLLAALLEPHQAAIDARRQELLDALAPDRAGDLRALTRVLVLPLAERLDDAAGRRMLRLQARMTPRHDAVQPATGALVARVNRAVGKRLPPSVARTRGELVQLMLFPALAERARREEEKRSSRRDRRAWVEALIDAVVGILAAPVGGERGS
jgi:AcrR family transcriptional regulator